MFNTPDKIIVGRVRVRKSTPLLHITALPDNCVAFPLFKEQGLLFPLTMNSNWISEPDCLTQPCLPKYKQSHIRLTYNLTCEVSKRSLFLPLSHSPLQPALGFLYREGRRLPSWPPCLQLCLSLIHGTLHPQTNVLQCLLWYFSSWDTNSSENYKNRFPPEPEAAWAEDMEKG